VINDQRSAVAKQNGVGAGGNEGWNGARTGSRDAEAAQGLGIGSWFAEEQPEFAHPAGGEAAHEERGSHLTHWRWLKGRGQKQFLFLKK